MDDFSGCKVKVLMQNDVVLEGTILFADNLLLKLKDGT
jgi:hypothetical protein